MEIFILLVTSAICWTLVLIIAIIFAQAVLYMWQEINHELKKAKRELKKAWWDIEWKLTH